LLPTISTLFPYTTLFRSYAFLQITRRRFLNEWEAFKKVISRRNIRRRITIPLTLSNLKLLRRITRTENILHRNLRLLRVSGIVMRLRMFLQIGRAVQQECRDRSRMPSSA